MKKLLILSLVVFAFGCRTSEIIQDPAKRAELLAMPEIQELLEANKLGFSQLEEVFCKQDPAARIFIRLEGQQILKDELGIDLSKITCKDGKAA